LKRSGVADAERATAGRDAVRVVRWDGGICDRLGGSNRILTEDEKHLARISHTGCDF